MELGLGLRVLGQQVERPRQVRVEVLRTEERLHRAAIVGGGGAELVPATDPLGQQVVALEAVAALGRECVDGRVEPGSEPVAPRLSGVGTSQRWGPSGCTSRPSQASPAASPSYTAGGARAGARR